MRSGQYNIYYKMQSIIDYLNMEQILTLKYNKSILICLFLIGRQRIPRITRFSRFRWKTGKISYVFVISELSILILYYLQGPPGHPGPDGPSGEKGVKVSRNCKLHNFAISFISLIS